MISQGILQGREDEKKFLLCHYNKYLNTMLPRAVGKS